MIRMIKFALEDRTFFYMIILSLVFCLIAIYYTYRIGLDYFYVVFKRRKKNVNEKMGGKHIKNGISKENVKIGLLLCMVMFVLFILFDLLLRLKVIF
jgi:hypothetical protein